MIKSEKIEFHQYDYDWRNDPCVFCSTCHYLIPGNLKSKLDCPKYREWIEKQQ